MYHTNIFQPSVRCYDHAQRRVRLSKTKLSGSNTLEAEARESRGDHLGPLYRARPQGFRQARYSNLALPSSPGVEIQNSGTLTNFLMYHTNVSQPSVRCYDHLQRRVRLSKTIFLIFLKIFDFRILAQNVDFPYFRIF